MKIIISILFFMSPSVINFVYLMTCAIWNVNNGIPFAHEHRFSIGTNVIEWKEKAIPALIPYPPFLYGIIPDRANAVLFPCGLVISKLDGEPFQIWYGGLKWAWSRPGFMYTCIYRAYEAAEEEGVNPEYILNDTHLLFDRFMTSNDFVKIWEH